MLETGGSYRYPADDLLTDGLEEKQDRYKRERESAVIKAMTAFNWYYGMDFGCGIGRNIPLLVNTMSKAWQRHILAVDPDPDRLEAARQMAPDLSDDYVNVEYLLTSGDNLRPQLGNVLFELILCCQVFTHMSRAEFARTIDTFESILTRDGVLVACVPFHCMDLDGDYYHRVDLSKSLETGELERAVISPEDYDRAAAAPAEGVLPVRAFQLDSRLPPLRARDLPLPVDAPKAFRSLTGFKVVSCLVYSIHRYDNELPVIGDLVIKLRKREE
jgi:SAM-dependent methyltransferase